MQLILLIILFICQVAWAQTPVSMRPPETRKDNVKEIIHDVEIVDPYRWLEDQESAETRAWIEEQNEYTASLIGNLPGRENLEKRLGELMRIDNINMPLVRNGRYFFMKRLADQELFVIYMRKGLTGKDEVLIDPHGMSPDRTTSVGLWGVSEDGTILAYGVRQGGEDEASIRLLDVNRLKDLPDHLPKARYHGFSFKPDNSGFYYIRHKAEGSRIYYHDMGTDPANDVEIFGQEYGPEKIISVSLSDEGTDLLIHVRYGAGASKTEIYYQDVAGKGPIVPVVKGIDAAFSGTVAGDKIYVQTTWKAPNSRVLAVNIKDIPQELSEWQEIIPETDATLRFRAAGGKLIVRYLENVVSRVKVFEPDGQYLRDIDFPASGTSYVSGRWKSNEAFFYYSSFHIPPTIYRYDVGKGTKEVWAKQNVPIKSDNIEVRQVWYNSKDGTKIPMFLVHQEGIRLDGSNPTLLTGYGGFYSSLTPDYSQLATIWVENGGVFAQPNLRGGGEFGQEWHKAGMLENKQNVFDDFISAAEWLIRKGYTNPDRLCIRGGSNGGLLVGAALTQRPELFKAVVCSYPLLDMVRYHKFLVAPLWIAEYGSADDPEQFKYLYAYSPYHQVKTGTEYPAVIFFTGDADTRVAPSHARKMAALLQNETGSDNPVLLHYETRSGHSGGQPLGKQIEVMTNWLGFLFWQLGMADAVAD